MISPNCIQDSTNCVQDPRCGYCSRPVIGFYITGNDGITVYHPECTHPEPLNNNPLGIYPNIFGLDYSKLNTLIDKLILLADTLNRKYNHHDY
jgi:hypothetical protein